MHLTPGPRPNGGYLHAVDPWCDLLIAGPCARCDRHRQNKHSYLFPVNIPVAPALRASALLEARDPTVQYTSAESGPSRLCCSVVMRSAVEARPRAVPGNTLTAAPQAVKKQSTLLPEHTGSRVHRQQTHGQVYSTVPAQLVRSVRNSNDITTPVCLPGR